MVTVGAASQAEARSGGLARVEEHEGTLRADGDLLVEAGGRERGAARAQPRLDDVRLVERVSVDGRGQRRHARLARIEDEQAVAREDRGEQSREGLREGTLGRVVGAHEGRDLLAGGAERHAQRVHERDDLGAEPSVRDRDPLPRGGLGGEPQRHGRAVLSRDVTRGDLVEVVVLGLQPVEGHAAHAGLGLERARRRDRRGGLVKGVERPEEQSDLLPRGDDGRLPARERGEARVARRARRQARLLLAQDVDERGVHPTDRGGAGRGHAYGRVAKVARQEGQGARARGGVVREMAAGERSTHRSPQLYSGGLGSIPMRTFIVSSLLVALCMTHSVNAAPPEPDAARIQLALRRLGVVGRVLYVAAHPDDENTSLLAYLRNNALVRAGYLSMTRGDGGQNLVGAEQGPELGLIRTQELLAARRIDGAEQWFTRARDFGFSKSPDETMRIWGRAEVLSDVVTVIRRFRPDVIITRFPPEKTDTHGHHTASAMLAVEAFRAAADPKYSPEELVDGTAPWQARRLLWNKSSWNLKPGEDLSSFIKLDVGGFNPLLGVSMGELAADSRSMHKSQGFGVARARGPIVEYFKVLDEAPGEAPGAKRGAGGKGGVGLFADVDLSWDRWGRRKGTARLRALTDKVARAFDPLKPVASIPALLEIDRALDAVPDLSLRAQKKAEVADLVLACAGLFVEANAAEAQVAPGRELAVTASVVNRSSAEVRLDEVRFPFADAVVVGKPVARETTAAAGAPLDTKQTLHVPTNAPPSTPYWLDAPPTAGLYRVADPKMIGAPESEPSLRATFALTIGGRAFTVTRAVEYKWTDPVMGERTRPVEITPLVSVRPDAGVLMFPDAGPRPLSVHLVAGAPGVTGVVRPDLPPGWTVEPASAPFSLATKGAEATVTFRVRPAVTGAAAGTLRVAAEVDGVSYVRGVVHIEHAHIPIQTWLADADVRLVPLALATGGTKLGYFPGPGDEVPASLRRVGYDVTLLDDAALTPASLARFDAVVTGVRAFNTSERLRAAHAALMAYVDAGGTLVVQYNTNNRLAPLSVPIGPWPFEIGQHRVTDEMAAVTFTRAAHPAVTTPNALGPRDFEGWIQERGLYFAETWDPRYQTVLSIHDPDEKPLAGSILWGRSGKGTFIYTGLAFFRELPAGVPGAYRLFANLLAGGAAHRSSAATTASNGK